jgi:hypothetical protein
LYSSAGKTSASNASPASTVEGATIRNESAAAPRTSTTGSDATGRYELSPPRSTPVAKRNRWENDGARSLLPRRSPSVTVTASPTCTAPTSISTSSTLNRLVCPIANESSTLSDGASTSTPAA